MIYLRRFAPLFLILCFVQVFVLNNIVLHGLLTPFPYILFILFLPLAMGRVSILLLSFFLGLTVDLLTGTGGIHASASVLIAFIRPSILKSITNESKFDDLDAPNMNRLGIIPFLIYVFILALIHHLALFFIDAYTFTNFFYTFFKAFLSAILTLVFVLIYSFFFDGK